MKAMVGFLMWAILLISTVATAVGAAYARHESRKSFLELTNLEKQRDELNIVFGRLKLEQATLAGNNRVEQIARGQLGMMFPGAADTQWVRP